MKPRKNIATIDYANARVRSARARLLTARDYDELIASKSLRGVEEFLEKTKYRTFLTRYELLYTGSCAVGMAVSAYLRNEYLFCQKFYTERQSASIEVLAGLLDLADFKTVVRGKFAGTAQSEIQETFMGPGLCIERSALDVLAAQDSLEDVVTMALALHVPFAAALKVGTERFALRHLLSELEVELDRAFYQWACKKLAHESREKSPVLPYIEARIDVQNIMTLARFVVARDNLSEQFDVGVYYLEGGHIYATRKKFLKAARAMSLEELADLIPVPHYAHIVRQQLAEYQLSDSLASLDKALFGDAVSRAIKTGWHQIESVGVSAAYLMALEDEVKNIRLIAHAQAFKLAPQTVREALVGV